MHDDGEVREVGAQRSVLRQGCHDSPNHGGGVCRKALTRGVSKMKNEKWEMRNGKWEMMVAFSKLHLLRCYMPHILVRRMWGFRPISLLRSASAYCEYGLVSIRFPGIARVPV